MVDLNFGRRLVGGLTHKSASLARTTRRLTQWIVTIVGANVNVFGIRDVSVEAPR